MTHMYITRQKAAGPLPEGGTLVEQQIAELQAAAAQNAANVKELAAQLQSTVAALELAAQLTEARLRRALIICALAMGVSVAALGVSFFTLLAR